MSCVRTIPAGDGVSAGFSDDAFLAGKLRLRQPLSGHRAGHDAILLAAATPVRPGLRVADFGAGVGAAGLAAARRCPGIDLVMVERDPELADLARGNASANGIAARVATLDIGAKPAAFSEQGLAPDSVDAVLMNPPFNDPARHRASPDAARRAAHVASPETLAVWTHAARRVLRPGGVLTLIWRSDGLAEVLAALDRGFGSVALLPVHHDIGTPALRILIRAIKGGRAPLQVLAGLMLNDESGLPSKQATNILAGDEGLPLADV
ncbi:MAG TPA: methyltransferase [Nitrobacter sp.]|nr:methyltransferase [Nitrobacter sp.]